MASNPHVARLCVAACRRAAPQLAQQRPVMRLDGTRAAAAFSTSSMRAAERNPDEAGSAGGGGGRPKVELKQLDKAFMDRATPEGLRQLDQLAKANGQTSIEAYLDNKLQRTPGFSLADKRLSDELAKIDSGGKVDRRAFWFDEDDPDTFTEEHDEFKEDDMLAMAHNKLDEVREMRHYTRLAVWEMPLLSSMWFCCKQL